MGKYKCCFCENIFEDYENESEKFEMFECPSCGCDVYFDQSKNKHSGTSNSEYDEERQREQEELDYLQAEY